jgi:hypothetical protein
LSYIKQQEFIDKDMVIQAIHSKAEMVGLEGHVQKTFTYTDSLFESHGWLQDTLGSRTLDMTTNAVFKMGIDLNDIKPEDVQVIGHSLFIKIPKQILISMDVPYDQIIYKVKTGLIRSELSEHEKQLLYTEARKLLTDNVMGNQSIIDKSVNGVEDALRGLLEKVPGCNRIVFKGV